MKSAPFAQIAPGPGDLVMTACYDWAPPHTLIFADPGYRAHFPRLYQGGLFATAPDPGMIEGLRTAIQTMRDTSAPQIMDLPPQIDRNGVRRHIRWTFAPQTDGGAPVAFTHSITDRSREVAAQNALKAELTREDRWNKDGDLEALAATIEAAPIAISIARDPQGLPPILNAEARRLTGMDGFDGDTGRYKKLSAIHADGRPYIPEDYPTVRAMTFGEVIRNEEMIFLRDGERRRWIISSTPVRNVTGDIVAAVTAFLDVEAQRRAEEHRTLLIGEMNHRVKNTLAVVQTIAAQSFRAGEPAAYAQATFQARLHALAQAHDLLTEEAWQFAALSDLVQRTLTRCGTPMDRVHIDGPFVLLPPKAAVSFALTMHELATNAAKYGALSNEQGRIEVEWSVLPGDEPHLHLQWRELDGPAVTAPTRNGFGTRMISRALAAELKGTAAFEFAEGGLVFALDAPLPPQSDLFT
ncbi:HWE histidine kinase domain-containing protein [Parvularcula dongshanensis]|uniref:histidine kinase n=1 Tax=Parvularcula dongshanensis TaxID=1173995 RepID=A0A840I2K2_9PROT|nr:two-component sensor histidine kinase [Parvularcula dongshanensis]